MSTELTGYRPSSSRIRRYRLEFNGDESKYELWEVKFLGHLRLQKLYSVITAAVSDVVDADKNAEVFAELVQCLDDRSLSLAIREAKDDGRKALGILRDHYLSKGMPRIISLYTELTSLMKLADESVTDYMIRAETAAVSLKTSGEVISDSLLIAMILKGLPSEFKPFTTVIMQKDKSLNFGEFKVALRSYEETEKACKSNAEKDDAVMKIDSRLRVSNSIKPVNKQGSKSSKPNSSLVCFKCGKPGHKALECSNSSLVCFKCGKPGHKTLDCSNSSLVCFKCGKPGHKALDCSNSSLVCFKCGKPGHKALECSNSSIVCFKCGKPGHKALDCSNSSLVCFKCGKPGHKALECSNSSLVCFKCGKPGHKALDCSNSSLVCFKCGKPGHKSPECYSKVKRWCEICKNHSHDTKWCRKGNDRVNSVGFSKNSSSAVSNYYFAFKVSVKKEDVDTVYKVNGLLVDCGATTHIVNDLSRFISFDENFDPKSHVIELADGNKVNNIALNRGSTCVSLIDSNGNKRDGILGNALYVPSFKQNIFSVQAATEKGASIEFGKEFAKLINDDGTVFDIEKHGNLYFLNNVGSPKNASYSLKEWHQIFGYCNVRDILNLENVVDGMNITNKSKFDCGVCIEGKMAQYRNREADMKANSVLELVHCDLAGPIAPVAKEGFRYALGFIDYYSGILMIYFIQQKGDTLKATEKFLSDCLPYGSVKCIRSDNGTEFTSNALESFLIKHCIKHEKSTPYSPHQNGTIERAWRSTFEMARCMLLESKLPKYLWIYAVMSTVYIRNRCFNARLGKTPYEVFTGRRPNVSGMHIFGSLCYAY